MTRLPGFAPPDVHPDSFLPIGEFAALLDRHARVHALPLLRETSVEAVVQRGDRFVLTTSRGTILARAVVIATGACGHAALPSWANALPAGVAQVTSDRFDAADLPPGGVLVVGASASGAQIAAELAARRRPVTLAAGRHVRAPRRYRGRDIFAWLDACGFLREPRPAGGAPVPSAPSLPLAGGPVPGEGEAFGLDRLHRMGVRVTGRALGLSGATMHLAPTLLTEVAAAERRRRRLLAAIDSHIGAGRDHAAPEPGAWKPPPPLPDAPERIDLLREGIRSVVWAAGYRRSYTWLKLPALGADGEILQSGGVSPVAGLFTLGLPFMRHRSSALIDGVGRDAEALLEPIARHLGHAIPLAA